MVERYLDLVQAGDRQGALDFVDGLAGRGVPVDRIVLELLGPAQREIGRRWEQGQCTVAEEHAATAIADAALALLALDAGPPPTRGHVLVGCVEGEWHVLAARMAAEVFRLRGWEVTFLGPSVPAPDLGAYVATTSPDAVALSCSVSVLLAGARRCIRACRDEGVAVLAGGPGFAADGRYAATLGADGWEPDPVAGASRLDRWLDSPPPGRGHPDSSGGDADALDAWRPDLVADALAAISARHPGAPRSRETAAAIELALAAVQSATLVKDPAIIPAAAPMIERVMADGNGPNTAASLVFECLLPGLRRHTPDAAQIVERALPGTGHRS